MHNHCNPITDKVKELAESLGKDPATTAIYINQWQNEGTLNDDRTSRYPTKEELKDYYLEKRPSVNTNKPSTQQNNNYSKLRKVYNSTVLNYRINDIAKRFSDEVNIALEEELERAQQHLSWALQKGDKKAISSLMHTINDYNSPEGRQAVIQNLTLSKIFSKIKDYYIECSEIPIEELDEDYGEGKGEYMHNEYVKILDNFDALMEEACNIISVRESFKIKPIFIENAEKERVLDGEIEKTDSEEFGEEENSQEDEDGNKVTGNGWDFKARLIDPYTTQSGEIRKLIGNIRKIGHNGKFVTDDLGNIQTLGSEWVDQCLRNGFKEMVDPSDFNYKDENTGQWYFPVLQKMLPKYPWVSQIIQELQNNPRLRGSFYANYRQDFIHYAGQTLKEDGTIGPTDFNKPVAEDSLFNEMYNNYKEKYKLNDLSIYDEDGTLNVDNAKVIKNTATKIKSDLWDGTISPNKQAPGITEVFRALGFNIDSDYIKSLMSLDEGVEGIIKALDDADKILANVNEANNEIDIVDTAEQYYRDIAQILGVVGEGDSISSFRDPTTKKDRNSYSAPNYMTTMLKQLKKNDKDFLDREFGQDSWFRKNGKWRNEWIRLLDEDESVRNAIEIKEVPSSLGVGYTDWKSNDVKKILLREFFALNENGKARHNYGWYVTPIPADAPVANFIKMKRYTGDFKKELIPLFRQVAYQELSRIVMCENREKTDCLKIQNFDEINGKGGNGKKFCFFPRFNSLSFMNELIALHPELQQYKGMKLIDACKSITKDKNAKALQDFIDKAITLSMNKGFASYVSMPNTLMQEIHGEFLKMGITKDMDTTRQKLEEYYWNHAFATTQMTELFVTDLAYFKDETDFQKRFKQCYAAGMRLNSVPGATDYGKEFRNNVYIKDQIITSSVYTDLKQALDEAVAAGRIMDYDRDNILYKFMDINVADAQAWITPETMRSVLDMMGKWDKEVMDPALERFKEGEWDMHDFDILWQTIKPFMYTQIQKPDGMGGWLRVPHQNKNSEYLVLAAFSTIAAATKNSSKLKAIHEFMRKNNIDSIQMESAVKCGGQGIIELNYGENRLQKALTDEIRNAAEKSLGQKGYSKASDYKIFKSGNDYLLDNGKISQEEYNRRMQSIEMTTDEIIRVLNKNVFLEDHSFNPEVVHTIPYKDYMIQQPTPEHLIDHDGIFGSQLRNIVIADLPDGFSITVDGKTYNKEQFIKEYQDNVVANVLQSFNKVNSRFSNIENLQGMLLDQVRSNSSKYGDDMIDALQIVTIVDKDGKTVKTFKMPLSNPSVSLRMQEIMTSAYKNGVTKQYIKGGNAILVSSWGKTDKLKLEYETDAKGKKKLAGIQCYLPASSKKFYEPFLKKVSENGNTYYELDVQKLKDAGLDKLIGYRIPTENKYSIVPLKVMGFLPQQNGSAIMLPAEITTIAGSDFDIDKMFLMIPEFYTIDYDMKRAKEDFKKVKADYEETDKLLKALLAGNDDLDSVMEKAPIEFKNWFKENRDKYKLDRPIIRKVKYDSTKSIQENSREQRNNHIIDLIYGMLTSSDTVAEVTTPGNFDTIKLHDRLAQIYNDPQALQEFKETFKLETDDQVIEFIDNLANSRKIDGDNALERVNDFIKDYSKKFNTGKDPLSPDTFIYNHRQNMTSGKLIGIYANNTSMHLKYQHAPITFKMPFKINGRTVSTLDLEFSSTGELITKNCAEFQAASVDGVKDPVLATLLQNEDTAKVTGLMLRSGLSIAEISYFFNQPSVRTLIESEGNLNHFLKYHGYTTKEGWQTVLDTVGTQDITSKMLLGNILKHNSKEKTSQDRYNEELANRFMAYFIWAADYLNDITNISRADSPNGAIANTLGGALIQTKKVDWIHSQSRDRFYPFRLSEGVPDNNYTPSYESLVTNPISTLQAFYTCGINKALDSLSQYFPQLNIYTKRMLQHILDNTNLDFLRYNESATKTIDDYFKAVTQFALGRTKLFGNDGNMTLEQKRDYYLSRFPEEFIKIKNSNEDIGKLGIIRKITFKNGRLVLDKSGRLRQFTKDMYMKDLDSLAAMGEDGRKLATDLFMYSFYADGFNFGPNSFGNLFSTEFFNNFSEVIDTLRNLDKTFENDTLYKRFLLQFISTHPDIVPRIKSTTNAQIVKGSIDNGDANKIYVPPRISINKTSYRGDYTFVTYDAGTPEMPNIKLYMLSQSGEIGTGDSSTYEEIPMYGVYGMYNPNYDLDYLVNFKPIVQVQQFSDNEDVLPDAIPDDIFDMPSDFDLPEGSIAEQQNQNIQQKPQQEFYSGAASGADKYWGEQARSMGMKVKDYTTEDWDNLPQEWKDRLDKEYKEVVNILGRKILDANTYKGKLVRRDMMQADKADAVFAIASITPDFFVKGGTAYAATRGMLRGIPVYVFDQDNEVWWEGTSEGMVVPYIDDDNKPMEPTLTPHAATIGTRGINDAGRQAIRRLLHKGINNQPTNNQVSQQQSRPIQQQVDMPEQSIASIIADLQELTNTSTDDDSGDYHDLLSGFNPDESNEINDFDLCEGEINAIINKINNE